MGTKIHFFIWYENKILWEKNNQWRLLQIFRANSLQGLSLANFKRGNNSTLQLTFAIGLIESHCQNLFLELQPCHSSVIVLCSSRVIYSSLVFTGGGLKNRFLFTRDCQLRVQKNVDNYTYMDLFIYQSVKKIQIFFIRLNRCVLLQSLRRIDWKESGLSIFL